MAEHLANQSEPSKPSRRGGWHWDLWLKVGVFVALAVALYRQFFHRTDLDDLRQQFGDPLDTRSCLLLVLVFLMMPLNWGLETVKWRLLVRQVYPISFRKAFAAVLTGVTLGLFTPNRIGEYGGRMLFLPSRLRWSAVPVTLVGSLAQLTVTVAVGMICLIVFVALWQGLDSLGFEEQAMSLVLGACVPIIVLMAFLWYLLQVPRNWFRYVPNRFRNGLWIRQFGDGLQALRSVSSAVLTRVLVLSLLRYSVFAAQYLFLLSVYGMTLPLLKSVPTVGSVFFVQSVLPTFAVVELFRRGEIATTFFGAFSDNTLAIYAASATLWLINLIIPALLGYVLILFRPVRGEVEDQVQSHEVSQDECLESNSQSQ